MHRCVVEPGSWTGTRVALPPEESHHLLQVLRAAPGEAVELLDGCGRVGEGRLVTASGAGRRAEAVVEIDRVRTLAPLTPELVLLQALPKATAMDWLIEKATELGVAAIQPVLTERTVNRLSGEREEKQLERWRRIALAAAKQCGTPWLPAIRPIRPLAGALAGHGAERLVVGALVGTPPPLREVIGMLGAVPRSVAILIGPEGDLSPAELDAAVAAGALPANFGPLVLRVETAALFALSALVAAYR